MGQPLALLNSDFGEVPGGLAPENCLACGAFRECNSPWLTGRGSLNATILFLFEAPGQEEDTNATILCGRSGQLWDKLAAEAGLNYPDDVRYDNVVMCFPFGTPRINTIRLCRRFWIERLKQMPKLKKVVCMGKVALISVLNTVVTERLDRFRRQQLFVPEFPDLTFYVSYHPARALRTPEIQRVIIEDLQYILRDIPGKDPGEPASPTMEFDEITDPVRPWSILGESNERPVLVLDFEHSGMGVDNPMPWPRGGKVGELLLCSYSVGRQVGVARLDIGPLPAIVQTTLADPASYFVAFNVHHELAWLYMTYGIWPAGRIFDPMIGFHLLDENYPDMSLEGILKKIFNIPPYKAEFWKAFDLNNIDWGKLSTYCMQDVSYTRRLAYWVAQRLLQEGFSKLFDHEMANRATATYGSIRGVRYHREAAGRRTAVLAEQALVYEARLTEIAGQPGINFSSPAQVLPLVQAYDSRVRNTDATTLRRVLWHQPENVFVQTLLSLRRVQSELRYLRNYEAKIYDDGLMHVETHPMSKTGRHRASAPNLQNVMR